MQEFLDFVVGDFSFRVDKAYYPAYWSVILDLGLTKLATWCMMVSKGSEERRIAREPKGGLTKKPNHVH